MLGAIIWTLSAPVVGMLIGKYREHDAHAKYDRDREKRNADENLRIVALHGLACSDLGLRQSKK